MQTFETEVWLDVPGFEGAYQVSSDGRVAALSRTAVVKTRAGTYVRSKKGGLLRPTLNRKTGYLSVCLSGQKRFTVAALVLRAFRGPRPDGQECLHRDGDKTNNALANLRYGTRLENVADAIAHGQFPLGEKVGSAKLTAADVQAIRASTHCNAALAMRYGVTYKHIWAIRSRAVWKHV